MEGEHCDEPPRPKTVVSELEGMLLRDPDPFSYFMLLAFEASGLVRFAVLLIVWPVIRLLDAVGMDEVGLRLMVFLAVAGVRLTEIESVARAVLPKFYMDDVDMEVWRVFSSCERRVVVTKFPRIMVERFVKEHLCAEEVVGGELDVNRFGFATGFLKDMGGGVSGRAQAMFKNDQPDLGLVRHTTAPSFLSHCKVSKRT